MVNEKRRLKTTYLDTVTQAVESLREELVAISMDIHDHPELNYQEYHAAEVLSNALERHGFAVERGVGGVETAFRGTIQGGNGDGPTVTILAEYDALPDVGHGCGHNLIAISALGGGLGAKAAMGTLPGRLIVLGTPRGGGRRREGQAPGGRRVRGRGCRPVLSPCLQPHRHSNGDTHG